VKASLILIVTGVIAGLLYATAPAQATVIGCSGIGVIASNNVQYGTCATDANGGTGSVTFSNDGSTAALSAKTKRAAEQVASYWQSNGPVNATSEICVDISVTQVSLRGSGLVQEQLRLSYNGAQQGPITWSVTTTGNKTYCGAIPAGATNVWWQLITLANANKPVGEARVSETLLAVRMT
jgi:hypothetical protein